LREEDREQFADDAQPGQHKDVDRRMRIEPEKMLEEQRLPSDIFAARIVERVERHPQRALEREHQKGLADQLVAVSYEAGRQDRPAEDWHAEERHSLGRIISMVTMMLSDPKIEERPSKMLEKNAADSRQAAGSSGGIGGPARIPAEEHAQQQ
jgi:Lon protease-like protein